MRDKFFGLNCPFLRNNSARFWRAFYCLSHFEAHSKTYAHASANNSQSY